jgi:hypothetical protein
MHNDCGGNSIYQFEIKYPTIEPLPCFTSLVKICGLLTEKSSTNRPTLLATIIRCVHLVANSLLPNYQEKLHCFSGEIG